MPKCLKPHSMYPELVCQLEAGHPGYCACSPDNRLIIPTVHHNGTSCSELLEQVENVVKALNEALNNMQKATPHGRDYYPQDREGYEAISAARSQFKAREEAVRKVRAEYYEIWNYLVEASRRPK